MMAEEVDVTSKDIMAITNVKVVISRHVLSSLDGLEKNPIFHRPKSHGNHEKRILS